MASLKRSYLKSLGLNDDQIEAVMDVHVEVTDAIIKDRDKYKADADKLPGVQKQLDDIQNQDGGKDYKKMYEDLVAENQEKGVREAKTKAFREILKSTGIADKYLDTVVRASADVIDGLEMDGDKVKDAAGLTKTAKETWGDFISAKRTKGSEVETPPGDGGDDEEDLGNMSMTDYIAARQKM